MNWLKGLTRVWLFLLGLAWALFAAVGLSQDSRAKDGRPLLYMLIATACWLALGYALTWVAKGFKKDE